MMKKIVIGIGVIVIAAAVGLYWGSQNLDGIVKAQVEKHGTTALGVPVSLGGVSLQLMDLRAALDGLKIGNPEGFKTSEALSLDSISVKLNENFSGKTVVIDEIRVMAPQVTYEIGAGGSNIDKIKQNVEQLMAVANRAKGSSSAEPASSPEDQIKLIISNFMITGGKVNVSSTLLGGKTLTTSLPDIHLTDIGKKSNGATASEVAKQIIEAVSAKAGGAASKLDLSQIGLDNIMGDAAGTAKKLMEGAGGNINEAVKGAVGSEGGKVMQDALGGAAKEAEGALKGLFGQ